MKLRRPLAVLPLAAALLAACSPLNHLAGDGTPAKRLDGRWAVRYVAGQEIPAPYPELDFDAAAGTLGGSDEAEPRERCLVVVAVARRGPGRLRQHLRLLVEPQGLRRHTRLLGQLPDPHGLKATS